MKLNIIEYDKKEMLINKNHNNLNNNNTNQIVDNNIVKEVMENLDRDEVDFENNLTSIDFNTRLEAHEIPNIVALQFLDFFHVAPGCNLLARSVKRNKVSLKGKGREEKVKIVQGEREHEQQKSGGSLWGRVKGFMGTNGGNNE